MTITLPPLHVGHGTTYGALTLFPLWLDGPGVTGLDWTSGNIRVAEREGSPVVDELVVENASTRPLVALEGDLLKGGFQDRMIATSILLAPHERRIVEALCVEHGRWSGGLAHNSRGERGSTSVRHGNVSMRGSLALGEDAQHEVWRRIGRYDAALGMTETSSMLDHLHGGASIPLSRIAGQSGLISGIGGRVIGGEIFGSPAGLRARWRGILDAAALDARLVSRIPTPSALARRFARELATIPLEDGGDAGLARQVRSTRETLSVSGIAVGGGLNRIIHLAAFDESHPLLENA
jgi:hypothetical protein